MRHSKKSLACIGRLLWAQQRQQEDEEMKLIEKQQKQKEKAQQRKQDYIESLQEFFAKEKVQEQKDQARKTRKRQSSAGQHLKKDQLKDQAKKIEKKLQKDACTEQRQSIDEHKEDDIQHEPSFDNAESDFEGVLADYKYQRHRLR
jgi:hypothetical protein